MSEISGVTRIMAAPTPAHEPWRDVAHIRRHVFAETVSAKWIYRHVPAYRPSRGVVLFRESEVRRWMEGQR